jgi:hypothetical protein
MKRYIVYYEKKGDKILGEFLLNPINLEILKKLFRPHSGDSNFVMIYSLNSDSLNELQQYLNNKEELPIDFNRYEYSLETYRD